MTLGNFPCIRVPLATTVNTLLTVSSVRVELACNFLVAFIIVVARRNRFWILSPASNTSSDRIESASFPSEPSAMDQKPGSYFTPRRITDHSGIL